MRRELGAAVAASGGDRAAGTQRSVWRGRRRERSCCRQNGWRYSWGAVGSRRSRRRVRGGREGLARPGSPNPVLYSILTRSTCWGQPVRRLASAHMLHFCMYRAVQYVPTVLYCTCRYPSWVQLAVSNNQKKVCPFHDPFHWL